VSAIPVQVRGAASHPCRARLEDCPIVPRNTRRRHLPLRVEQGRPVVPYGWVLTQSYDLPLAIYTVMEPDYPTADWNELVATGTYLGTNLIHVRGNTSIIRPSTCLRTCTLAGVTYNRARSEQYGSATQIQHERPEDGAKYGYAAEIDGGGTQQSYHGMVLPFSDVRFTVWCLMPTIRCRTALGRMRPSMVHFHWLTRPIQSKQS